FALYEPTSVRDPDVAEARDRGPSKLRQWFDPAALRSHRAEADYDEDACESYPEEASRNARGGDHAENDECRKPGKRKPCALVTRRRQHEVALEHDEYQRQYTSRAHAQPLAW